MRSRIIDINQPTSRRTWQYKNCINWQFLYCHVLFRVDRLVCVVWSSMRQLWEHM